MESGNKAGLAPFGILRGSGVTLVEQVAKGLRRCIATGYYKPGEVLPSTRDLAGILGISRRITREAVGVLVDSGLISARPGRGCVVLAKNERVWRGCVLLVSRGDWGSYYVQKFAETFTSTLLKAGCLVTQIIVPHDGKKCDCSGLDAALTSRYDFVFQIFDSKEIEARLAAASCRYVVLGDPGAHALKARFGSGFFSKAAVSRELVAAFKSRNVKTVLAAGIFFYSEFKVALARARIRARWMPLPCLKGYSSPEGVQRAALLGFQKWLAKTPSGAYPDVLLLTDDYTAAGALTALDAAGVRVPEDLGVVTMANVGLGPVWRKDVTRMDVSPQEDGRKAADFVEKVLSGGSVPAEFLVEPTWVSGETL